MIKSIAAILIIAIVAPVSAWAVNLDFLYEARHWGEPPCATCAELQSEELLPVQLNEDQVYGLAKNQLETINPSFINDPPADFISEWCPNYKSFDVAKKL